MLRFALEIYRHTEAVQMRRFDNLRQTPGKGGAENRWAHVEDETRGSRKGLRGCSSC